MGVRELVGDANGVPASEKVKKHWLNMLHYVRTFSIYACVRPKDLGCIKEVRNHEKFCSSKTLLKMAVGGRYKRAQSLRSLLCQRRSKSWKNFIHQSVVENSW